MESCGQKCGRTRVRCPHTCRAVCHPALPCPDVECEEVVQTTCPCGRRSASVRCEAVNGAAVEKEAASSLLQCDEVCEVELRNARLRESLSVDDSRPVLPYPSILMQAVLDRVLLDFCIRAEKRLNDWLDDSAAPTKMFPSMKADQRWLLHQLAAYYHLTAESLDAEPNRSVRLIRGGQSSIPSVSLSSATRTFLGARTGKGVGVRGLDERRVLHLVGLTVEPGLSVHDVRTMFHDWEGRFTLNWLDDSHAFAVFDERGMRERAREQLLTRGLWSTERDERIEGEVEADDDAALCLFRKLRTTEGGRVQGAVRDRDRKRAVTSHDGFTSVVTSRKARDAPLPFPSTAAAAPQAGCSASASRPLVSLRGLKQLQRLHAEGTAVEARPAPAPSASWRAAEEAAVEAASAEAEATSRAATEVAAAAPTPLQSTVGLYVRPVQAVRQNDNRWAALMEMEEGEAEESTQPTRRGRKERQRQVRLQRQAQSTAETKAEAGGDETAAEEDWLQSANARTRGKNSTAGSDAPATDAHSAW